MDSIRILGVRVDKVNYAQAIARVDSFLAETGSHQIATVNPEFVVLAQSDSTFMRVLNSCALNVPDGVGLIWASRRLGMTLQERVTGQEMVDRIAALAAEHSESIFLLGARQGVAQLAAERLKAKHRGLVIAGCYAGSPTAEEEQQIVDRVNESGSKVLFVAFGPPQQEFWIARNASRLHVRIAMGVGGTFDTLAGVVRRAPRWVQRAGFEWTYRLLREPRRFKRQLAIPYFMWLIIARGKNNLSKI
jgi:N-acetylglucosaminyldiphosphoundecaprenol N-acetyl-beta-D-mannosaminyltransferase